MKRSMYLWLLCLPFWALTACSGDDGDETPPPGEEPPATEELVGSETRQLMQLMEAMDPERALARVHLVYTDEEYEEIKAFTTDLVAGKTGEAAYDAIFKWVTENVKFAHDETVSQDPYEVFQNKVAVCQGYANLTKTMCLTQGIPCATVNGFMDPGTLYQQGHAWNYVWTGERWIVSDPTNNRQWDMVEEVNDYTNILEPLFMNEPVAEDDNFVYTYYRSLNVNEIKTTAESVTIPDAVLGYYVNGCFLQEPSQTLKSIELNAYIDFLGERGSEFLGECPALEYIGVAEGNTALESYEGVLYYRGESLPVIIPPAMRVVHLKAADFGKGVITHSPYAEEIHFAEGTTSIGADAVEDCPNLKTVYVPEEADVAPDAFPEGVEVKRF